MFNLTRNYRGLKSRKMKVSIYIYPYVYAAHPKLIKVPSFQLIEARFIVNVFDGHDDPLSLSRSVRGHTEQDASSHTNLVNLTVSTSARLGPAISNLVT